MRPALLACSFVLACAAAFPAWSRIDSAPGGHEQLLVHALDALGTKYRYGGRSPQTGFDCSGLIAHVFKSAWGLLLPAGTRALSRVGTPVRKVKDLVPGDLVFYNTRNRPYSHVGIYLGDGRFVHAPKPGARVRVESLETPYWRQRFNGARRIDPPAGE